MSDLLALSLQAAVPLYIAELQAFEGETRWVQAQAWRVRAVEEVAHRGDVLQYGGGKKGEAARVFNALARGLAVLAHAPGGVLFAGIHWCIEHPNGLRCQSAGDLTCSASGFDADLDAAAAPRPRRELVTVRAVGEVL